MTPLKAIRAKCLECCAGSCSEVKLCCSSECPLFPYRFGKMLKKGYKESLKQEYAEKPLILHIGNATNGHIGEVSDG